VFKPIAAFTILLACLPLAAQQDKFAGTWEARFKDKVICTMRIKAGDPITGETSACSISVDANGDLQEPDHDAAPDSPSPMLNIQIHGDTLTFEDKEDDDVIKFEMKLTADGQAALTILNAPMQVKPIPFTRK